MARLTMTAAAAAAGVSRVTLHRYVKAGKLSADTDARGHRMIDSAELLRVFGPMQRGGTLPGNRTVRRDTPGATSAATVELVEELRRQIAALEAERAELRSDLRAEREHSRRLLDLVEKAQPRQLSGPGLLEAVAGWFTGRR